MDEDLEKVRKRVEKRLEQYDNTDNEGKPFNDAMNHLQSIEGYPSTNLRQFNSRSLPLPIRIIGYVLCGFIGLSVLIIIVFTLIP
ncbi:hypothetical protein BN1058_00276 [Paraliobacillus sp. PM-2]|uniref:hypothetical protein n=1 Tax=Paraliobacillus sp. PM-2 TaxID=1462524 RepID=UPI00061BA282|nr:hypothetical protein [Paraliobacillus sp. PM-2]CQR46032.1 hypothetical protein BN1058_00276 [Paraliobacillus sp. PM-2]